MVVLTGAESGVGVGVGAKAGAGAGEGGFRVCLSLGRYFNDERRRAMLWIQPGDSCRLIRHFERRVRNLFRLTGAFCLLKDDLLLPATEDVRVLYPDDTVTVTPLSESFHFSSSKDDVIDGDENIMEKEVKKKKRKKQKDLSDDNSAVDDGGKINDRKKNGECATPSSTPERSVAKKSSIIDNPKVLSAIENIEKLHAELTRPVEEDEMKSKTLAMLKELASPNINTLPSLVSDGRITKRKRVRIRKSKKNNQSMVSSLSEGESNTPHRSNTMVLINGKINSHIRFQPNDTSPVAVLRNKSHNIDEKPRIIQAIQSSKVNSIPQTSSVINSEHFINTTVEDSHLNLNTILKEIDKFPPANVFPKENDIILFKMLKINEQYTPVLSNYILGKVSNACIETSFVKFSILDGHSECVAPAGKFDLEECINDENNTIDEIDLVWNQVINPKCIQS